LLESMKKVALTTKMAGLHNERKSLKKKKWIQKEGGEKGNTDDFRRRAAKETPSPSRSRSSRNQEKKKKAGPCEKRGWPATAIWSGRGFENPRENL